MCLPLSPRLPPLPQRRLHSEIKRQICLERSIYKNIFELKQVQNTRSALLLLLPPAPPFPCLCLCVHKDIWNFEFGFVLDSLWAASEHLLDVFLKGAVLALLLIYSANRSVFKVNTFTVAWPVFEATAVDVFMARLWSNLIQMGSKSHLNGIPVA